MQDKPKSHLAWFSEGEKQVALYHDAERIIHAEVLDSTRWLLWQFKANTDKRLILKQGRHRHPKQACEQALARLLGFDVAESEGQPQTNRRDKRQLGVTLIIIGSWGLVMWHWFLAQPVRAMIFILIQGALVKCALYFRRVANAKR